MQTISMTLQEAADELSACGLDVPSLVAILQAVRTVEATGFGVISLTLQNNQVALWRVEVTGKTERKQKG